MTTELRQPISASSREQKPELFNALALDLVDFSSTQPISVNGVGFLIP